MSNRFDAFGRQVIARCYLLKNVSKFDEVDVLLGFERVLVEEWNDVLNQVLVSSNAVLHPVAMVHANHATTEVAFQGMKDLHVALVLNDGEFRQYLESSGHFLVGIDPDVETAFAVDKTSDPLCIKCHRKTPERKVSEGSWLAPGLPCGLSPCPSDFYCRIPRRVPSGFGGVSRIWFGFTKASDALTLGPL